MGGKKTSLKLKEFSKLGLTEWALNENLFIDKKLIVETLVEAILENDLDTFRDVLKVHLKVISKSKLSKKSGISRKQLYNLISDGNFDPKISTLGAIFKALKAG